MQIKSLLLACLSLLLMATLHATPTDPDKETDPTSETDPKSETDSKPQADSSLQPAETTAPTEATETEDVSDALTWKRGIWELNISGNINAHYVYTSTGDDPAQVDGSLLYAGESGAHSVQNGLLPTALIFTANGTTKDEFDLGVTVGFYNGLVSNTALAFSGVDLRQAFMTFGKKNFGTIKAGRDFGIFGFDAIIADMTLLGVGAPLAPLNPDNTTLGGIGSGYIYCDRLSQINYTTPSLGGFTATAGVFQPLDMLGGLDNGSQAPGLHGKLAYSLTTDNIGLNLSATALSQSVDNAASDYQAYALDFFGQLTVAGFGLTGYYYLGEGVGTTALFLMATDENGNPVASNGYMGQLTYTIGKVKLGVNYGSSNLDAGSTAAPTMLNSLNRITGGVYYTITDHLTLLSEVSNTTATNREDGQLTNNSVNVGAFLAF